jgi:hypothetical protein
MERTLTVGIAFPTPPTSSQPATPTTAESGGRRRLAASTEFTAPQAAVNLLT